MNGPANPLGVSNPTGSALLDVPPRVELRKWVATLVRLGIPDALAVGGTAADAVRFSRLSGTERDDTDPPHDLERRWYRSVEDGRPDYGIYDDPDYLAELWSCWVIYSRGYLRAIARSATLPPKGPLDVVAPKTVADLGCGFGYTTAALTELLPGVGVVGTNLPGTDQYRIAAALGDLYGFRMAPEVDGPVDLVVAFEYFEHFERPVDHLRDVLAAARPRAVLVANTFTSPAPGHFPTYDVDGERLSGPSTSRRFGAELRRRGYERIDMKVWNGRPSLWIRP